MFSCHRFWMKKKDKAPPVGPVTPLESGTTASAQTGEEPITTKKKKKKEENRRGVFKWCFWRKKKASPSEPVTSLESDATTPAEVPQTERPLKKEKKEVGIFKRRFWRKTSEEKRTESPERCETMTPGGDTTTRTPILAGGNMDNTTPPSPIRDKPLLTGGLKNFDNNCYVNASLQCLFSAETFCRELSDLVNKSTTSAEDPFLRCFLELSKMRKSSEANEKIRKKELLLSLIHLASEFNPEFNIYTQNDAHEFLCYCLTQIEESGRGLGWQENAISNFMFTMNNTMTCSCCGSQKTRMETFNHLSVPLVHNSLEQCLQDMTNTSTDIEITCSECGEEIVSSRWRFHSLPKFLILQLNRFKMKKHSTTVKLRSPVKLQPELRVTCSALSDTSRTENIIAEDSETDRNEVTESASEYRLISVLRHLGKKPYCGHYLSDCYSQDTQQWRRFNDKLVTLSTEENVLRKGLTNAYVLLYERLSTEARPLL